METKDKILRRKLIAIVRGQSASKILRLAEALLAGGIELMEITFNQNAPETTAETCDTIRSLGRAFAGKMEFGAGTVVTLEQLRMSADAGARFIISPNVNPQIIGETQKLGLMSIPGAMTPTEILLAHDSGADFVKVFPAGMLGTAYIKAVRGPLNHIRLMAVGGINENNAADYLTAGCVGLGVGGNLVNSEWIRDERWEDISRLAAQYVKAVASR